MDSLFILEPGAYLKKEGECLKVMRNDQVMDTIPATGLQQLTLAGRASISGAVLDFLIKNNIDTVFLTQSGRFRARLLLDESGHVVLRQNQYLRLADEKFRLDLARIIVRGKLENQAQLLFRRARQYGLNELRRAGIQIRALKDRLNTVDTTDEVRGVEGYGARIFYSVFGLLIRNDQFSFHGRNRRPPRDPVNALLSFVYTLLTNEVLNGIKRVGLDPYLGALHEVAPGRPSLACDLVEEWRILGEQLVLTLMNRKVIRADDFVTDHVSDESGARPVLMKPGVSRALIDAYYRRLNESRIYPHTGLNTGLRWIIHSQCRRLAESLQEGARPYTPFLLMSR